MRDFFVEQGKKLNVVSEGVVRLISDRPFVLSYTKNRKSYNFVVDGKLLYDIPPVCDVRRTCLDGIFKYLYEFGHVSISSVYDQILSGEYDNVVSEIISRTSCLIRKSDGKVFKYGVDYWLELYNDDGSGNPYDAIRMKHIEYGEEYEFVYGLVDAEGHGTNSLILDLTGRRDFLAYADFIYGEVFSTIRFDKIEKPFERINPDIVWPSWIRTKYGDFVKFVERAISYGDFYHSKIRNHLDDLEVDSSKDFDKIASFTSSLFPTREVTKTSSKLLSTKGTPSYLEKAIAQHGGKAVDVIDVGNYVAILDRAQTETKSYIYIVQYKDLYLNGHQGFVEVKPSWKTPLTSDPDFLDTYVDKDFVGEKSKSEFVADFDEWMIGNDGTKIARFVVKGDFVPPVEWERLITGDDNLCFVVPVVSGVKKCRGLARVGDSLFVNGALIGGNFAVTWFDNDRRNLFVSTLEPAVFPINPKLVYNKSISGGRVDNYELNVSTYFEIPVGVSRFWSGTLDYSVLQDNYYWHQMSVDVHTDSDCHKYYDDIYRKHFPLGRQLSFTKLFDPQFVSFDNIVSQVVDGEDTLKDDRWPVLPTVITKGKIVDPVIYNDGANRIIKTKGLSFICYDSPAEMFANSWFEFEPVNLFKQVSRATVIDSGLFYKVNMTEHGKLYYQSRSVISENFDELNKWQAGDVTSISVKDNIFGGTFALSGTISNSFDVSNVTSDKYVVVVARGELKVNVKTDDDNWFLLKDGVMINSDVSSGISFAYSEPIKGNYGFYKYVFNLAYDNKGSIDLVSVNDTELVCCGVTIDDVIWVHEQVDEILVPLKFDSDGFSVRVGVEHAGKEVIRLLHSNHSLIIRKTSQYEIVFDGVVAASFQPEFDPIDEFVLVVDDKQDLTVVFNRKIVYKARNVFYPESFGMGVGSIVNYVDMCYNGLLSKDFVEEQ